MDIDDILRIIYAYLKRISELLSCCSSQCIVDAENEITEVVAEIELEIEISEDKKKL